MSVKINVLELCGTDFELTDIYAMRQIWTNGSLFTTSRPRKSNGIIYLNCCEGVYTDHTGAKINAPRGSIVFLPHLSEYSVLNLDCSHQDNDAFLIEFNMRSNENNIVLSDKPFVIKENASSEIASLIIETVRLYEASIRSYPAIKGKIFNLISELFKNDGDDRYDRFASIRRGIDILEQNVYINVSIEEIARSCGVSAAHFRRLFHEYSQKSPISYRIELKISYAKRMLTDTDMTVEAIAEALSFESSSYFCRIFKRKTGMTPSEYRRT